MGKNKRDERTLKFVEDFKKLFHQGMSHEAICKKYGISKYSGYKLLHVVAEREGVPRESLLRHPKSFYERTAEPTVRQNDAIGELEIEELFILAEAHLIAAKEQISKAAEEISKILEEEK